MQTKTETVDHLVCWADLRRELGSPSRSSVDRWERAGDFPQRIHLSKNRVAWYRSEIDNWKSSRRRGLGVG